MHLSIVIPTLNAARHLPATLRAAAVDAAGEGLEIVVVDGGSADETRAVAEGAGARVVTAPRGRGQQLAAGAGAARGDWLLFLHADSQPEAGWHEAARAFASDPDNAARAGYFRFRLDDDHRAARRIEAVVAWRNRALALPYGDQGLLLSRTFYEALGGYPPAPLMEDVALVRRIGRRRLVALDAAIVTSAERYRRNGWVLRPMRNALCLGLYAAGVPPRHIARLYG